MSGRYTLALDASTYRGTVAVLAGETLVAAGAVEMRGKDEERLMPAVASALASAGVAVCDLARVVCGGGPGSFTSLRIAASIAKGLALGAGVPLVAVPSLALVVAADRSREPGRWVATMDAMRGERYAALVELGAAGRVVRVSAPSLLPQAAVAAHAAALGAVEVRAEDAPPAAEAALRVLAAEGVDAAPVSLDAWEPLYGRLAEAQVQWEAAHGRPLPRA